ncbi:uncharacterized protein F4812DRAFT_468057 [Daldinia caldariorum]|uniref:uncharacterized protein n=1 Tax=Daldinia caldariorum TaxID=326644 RepID=UPI002007D9D3|nr:uncharacterized protein F4812DRAFT_468057 [Daldinia caldariorum]KAI1464438.1 hypothetical protein F4812DRAFT_468057 [Daldinia caldariorum]
MDTEGTKTDRKAPEGSPDTAPRRKGFTRTLIKPHSRAPPQSSHTLAVPSVSRSLRVRKAPTSIPTSTGTTIKIVKPSICSKSTRRGATKRKAQTEAKKAPISTGTTTEGGLAVAGQRKKHQPKPKSTSQTGPPAPKKACEVGEQRASRYHVPQLQRRPPTVYHPSRISRTNPSPTSRCPWCRCRHSAALRTGISRSGF